MFENFVPTATVKEPNIYPLFFFCFPPILDAPTDKNQMKVNAKLMLMYHPVKSGKHGLLLQLICSHSIYLSL